MQVMVDHTHTDPYGCVGDMMYVMSRIGVVNYQTYWFEDVIRKIFVLVDSTVCEAALTKI